MDWDCSVIGCMSQAFLDEELAFPCTRRISEAMRQKHT